MLDTLRKGANGPVAKIMMGLLTLSFVIWGVSGSFNGDNSTAVATVQDTDIPVADLERQIKIDTRDFSEKIGQQLTPAEAAQYGIPTSALSKLIALTSLDVGAKKMGLSVSDQTVTDDIMSDPQLKGAYGKFDPQSFRLALQRAGVNEKAFIADRRNFIQRKQYTDPLTIGVTAPTEIVDAIWAYQTETRGVDYFVLPPEAVGTIADPYEKTIEAYYKQASVRFMEPERRDFTFMVLNPTDLAATISISDADLKAAYDQRRAEFDVAEKRTVEQIPFATEDAAKAASEKLKKGESEDAILKEIGMKKADISLGSVTRTQMLSPALGDAAFSLKQGEYSEPVKGPLSTVILHVTAIEPGKMSSFDEVKDKLRGMMAQEKAQSQVYDVQNAIEDSRAGGMSLEDIAAKNGLKLKSFKEVTPQGTTPDGKKIEDLPAIKDLVDTVFRTESGDHTPPADSGQGGYYWLRVDAVKPSSLKPLKDVRADVVKLWKEEKRKADLDVLAQKLADRGNKGESIATLAASVKAKPETSAELKRNAEDKLFSRQANARLFAAPQSGFAYGPDASGPNLLVMQVKDIQKPKPDQASQNYIQLRASLSDSVQNDVFITYVSALQSDLGVEINKPLLQRVMTSETAQQ